MFSKQRGGFQVLYLMGVRRSAGKVLDAKIPAPRFWIFRVIPRLKEVLECLTGSSWEPMYMLLRPKGVPKVQFRADSLWHLGARYTTFRGQG